MHEIKINTASAATVTGLSKRNVLVTGAAGLVGMNLLALLSKRVDLSIIAIDNHSENMEVLRKLYPGVVAVTSDLAERGSWSEYFRNVDVVVMVHAQITGKTAERFVRNNIVATEHVLSACRQRSIKYLIHASSSVINSIADDDYTRTKKEQERLVRESGIKHCILRPTLMFGWFDPKHLGWLARFMERVPVFPIPGNGRYMRQPLYNRDFCRVIEYCIDHQPDGKVYDLVGPEKIDYVDIIRTIKRVKQLRTPIVHIPYWLFYALLRIYSLFSKQPPFTADQLKVLTAGDEFIGVNMEKVFGLRPTPFEEAIRETFLHPQYSSIVLKR